MAVKTKEQLKAETLKELEEEEKRLREAEEKKKAAENQAKANKEADLIGAKDAEKLNSGKKTTSTTSTNKTTATSATSSTGSKTTSATSSTQAAANKEADLVGAKDAEKLNPETKTTSSTSAADRAKNSSVTKNATATEAKQTVSDATAKRAGAEEGVKKIENAKTEKTTARAKANKEADLPGYDGYAAQEAYKQQIDQEKTEYLNIKEARDKKYQLEQELEELKQQAKNQTKEEGTAATVSAALNPRKGANTSVIDPELQKRMDDLEKEINDLNKRINLASGIQNQKYLHQSAIGAEDFEEYSHEPVKEQETGPKAYKQANIERETETVKGYMNEDERAIYNYYYNKYGPEKAEEYFESIRGELNKRQAKAMFAGNEGNVLNEYIIGAAAGLEGSKEGYQGALRMLLGDDTIQPTGTYSYLSQMAREDLADTGIKLPETLGGASLGQIGFDVVNTTANMLPSIALGTFGGSAVGAAAIGTSAAGKAYNNALAEGYSKDQATNYAVLVGASEACLGYALGGIEATGGKISNAALGKVLPKIDNALAKAAVNVSGKMASEFSEEYLQEVLTPVFENIALKEENEIDLLSEEAIYAGILGALSAGGIAMVDGSINVPEATVKTEAPVPFNGMAQPGTEAAMVADKITEIENRPISEAEKAAAMEKVVEAVAQNGTEQGLIEEAEKFRDIHKERQGNFVPAIKANINEINKIPPVITITENKFSQKNTGLKLTESVKNFFQSLGGKVNRTGFGEVLLSQSGVRKSISSGIGEEKAKAFEAVPEVIKYGLQVDFQENFKNRGYDTYTFAAPYITDEGKRVLGVIVKQDANSNRYYLHEVVDENGEIIYKTKETPDNAIKTGPDQNGQDTGALPEVSDNIIHPVTGFDNTSTIGNNVFGAGIFGKGDREAVSAEISDSAKRVLEQMTPKTEKQSSTSQVNLESESTNLVDVPQSEKSKRIERRYQRAVEEGVASVFGIDRKDIREDIRPILEEIGDDIKNGNRISDEQIENLYKKAFESGYITEEFPQYEETRKYIRSTPIFVDEATRHEFGDDFEFRDFARSNFGSIKISSDPRSRHIDDFYKSLSEIDPEFFDAEETDPRSQLENIADFMQQTKKQYYGLSEVYSGTELSEFEDWAKKELRAYMDEFGKGLDNVRRYERDRQIKATNKAREIDRTASFEQAKAAFDGNRVFEAQKAMEKAKANALLNDNDLLTVKRLHEGTLNEADVLALGGNVEGILEVYKTEKAYRQARAPFDRYKVAYKTALQHDAVQFTELSDEWTDKKIGFAYSRETAERNIRDIAGKGGERVISEYFEPVHENEAMKIRWIKEMNQRVSDLELGKMNRFERAYAQMIGENAAYIAEGKLTKHNQAEHDALNERISVLLREHGKKIDKAKCEKAAAGFMDIYKDICEEWNDERIRRGQEPVGEIENYFPHFVETKPETLIQKFFSLFGFDISSSKLPTDIAGRTADRKPQSKYNPHANRRTSDVTDYDILKGFDGYVRAVGDNIYHTEDIQKLRALSDTIRTKYSSKEIEKRIEDIRNRMDLSEEDKEALIADVFKADPGAYHLSNFVVWLDEYTNILAGKKSRGDREAEYHMGREIYDVSKALEGRIASNMIGYNLSTPVMNFVPMFQATADVSPVDIVSSFMQTGVAALKGDSFISDNSDFLTNRFGTDSVYKKNYNLFTAENMKDFVAKVSDGGGLLMEYVDRIVSESLVRARYEQNIKKGLDKVTAFSEADQWAAGLIADRSLGALPIWFNKKNSVAKALTMFQVEANNQYSYILKDAGKYKWKSEGAFNTIAGQLAFWAAMAICNGLADELLGRDNVVPDPIGMTADAIEKIQNGEKVGDVALDTATNIVEQIPFVGGLLGGGRIPFSTAFPDFEQAIKFFNPEVSAEKKQQILADELFKPMSYILFPSGAGQLWKTGKGIQQIIEGGAYGTENDGSKYLKFPQEYDAESIIKTVLFGQYASDKGQEYIDSNFQNKLSAKQTEKMGLAEQYGISKEDFYDVVMGLKEYRTEDDKQEALFSNPDLTAEEKEILDYVLFGKPTYKAAEIGYVEPERSYISEEEFYRSELTVSENRLLEAGYSEEDAKTIEKAFSNGKNKVETIAKIQEAFGCTEAEAYKIYQQREGNWIGDFDSLSEEEQKRAKTAADYYGMSTEEYLTVYNYSKFGTVITNKEGKEEYSSSMEDVVPNLAKTLGVTETRAEELYRRVNSYDYTREDLEQDQINDLNKMAMMYGVDDKGYFVAKNAILIAEGQKDEYGNTISGTEKAEAIDKIKKQLGISEEEATIYYLAARGDLILSKDDLSTSHREDLKAAKKYGWTERQYIDAVNLIKVSGASKKDDIIKTLTDAGATYEMAQGYYNLRKDKDYHRSVAKTTIAYGMSNQKQADKIDYYMEHYNSNDDLSAEDVAKWTKASKGLRKKADIVAAYESAGATHAEALKLYALMYGHDKAFNAYYKENGGND